jgi:hypothetical protein
MKRHAYGNDAQNTDLADTLNSMGDLYLLIGDYPHALVKFEEALAMSSQTFAPDSDHPLLNAIHATWPCWQLIGDAEDACAHCGEGKDDDCVFDVLATGDLEMAMLGLQRNKRSRRTICHPPCVWQGQRTRRRICYASKLRIIFYAHCDTLLVQHVLCLCMRTIGLQTGRWSMHHPPL